MPIAFEFQQGLFFVLTNCQTKLMTQLYLTKMFWRQKPYNFLIKLVSKWCTYGVLEIDNSAYHIFEDWQIVRISKSFDFLLGVEQDHDNLHSTDIQTRARPNLESKKFEITCSEHIFTNPKSTNIYFLCGCPSTGVDAKVFFNSMFI